jgi:methylmalonyl-CoA/ethylmalonyl-CoA epimerase
MIEYEFFGKGGRLHHVGLAVQSIHEVSPASEIIVDEEAGVSMAFVRLYGTTIELLEPYGEKSPIARSLREGHKLLHLCYEVADLEEALRVGRAAGFHRIRAPRHTPVYDDRKVTWVFSKQYGLVELVEQRNESASA